MNALTLYQPWASLVALGEDVKPHETRGWPTHYRGPLAIHAGKEFTRNLRDEYRAAAIQLHRARPDLGPLPEPPVLGAIVAVAWMKGCRPVADHGPLHDLDRTFGNWSVGRFAWRLTDVRALPVPVPCRGAQGIWVVTPEVLARVNAALGETSPR